MQGEYFGPYPHAGAVRETLSLLQKLFPIRQCENSVYNNRSRPCLQYQIGRCLAPCVSGYVTEQDYQAQVEAGQETLILSKQGREINLALDDLALHLIQHIRDESHNHAISGHRKKRQKAFTQSGLALLQNEDKPY